MITLEQALRDQQDLDALFDWQPADVSVEKYDRNNGYGWAAVLKEYSGYPAHLPVEAVIPHGVYFDAERVAREELEAPVPAVLNYPAFRSNAWALSSDKTVIASASPFLYALSMFSERFPQPESARGTIFYPSHGTDTIAEETNIAALVHNLKALDDARQPVTICVHYSDYGRGLHLPFLDAGFDVVSAGNTRDPEFIYRWLHLLSLHRFAASNDIGGCAFFSVKAGTPFSLIGDLPKSKLNPGLQFVNEHMGLFDRYTSAQIRETAAQIRGVFADEQNGDLTKSELVDYLLGAENFKSAPELYSVLEQAAALVEAP